MRSLILAAVAALAFATAASAAPHCDREHKLCEDRCIPRGEVCRPEGVRICNEEYDRCEQTCRAARDPRHCHAQCGDARTRCLRAHH